MLQHGYLNSPFSLAEVRVLYELAHRQRRRAATATDLAATSTSTPGISAASCAASSSTAWSTHTPRRSDGRQSHLELTAHGRAVFEPLDAARATQIGGLLARLPTPSRRDWSPRCAPIQALLGERAARGRSATCSVRPAPATWAGWSRGTARCTPQEYGYDERFEALVAGIVAKFVDHFDPERERCWIAERDGQPVGCIFLVRGSRTVGKLRLFLVEPSMRGLGIGARLIEECVRFARAAGYRKVRLWTQSELLAARRLYERAGFLKIDEEAHDSWSRQDLVSETWELPLQPRR